MARILVVDDESDSTDLLKFLFEKDGHEVIEAADGREGLEKARQEAPDLIILDVMMPEMDGVRMNSHLLADAATRGIPVIVLTAKGRMQDAFAAAGNLHAYMEKPFDPKELRARVAAALIKKTDRP